MRSDFREYINYMTTIELKKENKNRRNYEIDINTNSKKG